MATPMQAKRRQGNGRSMPPSKPQTFRLKPQEPMALRASVNPMKNCFGRKHSPDEREIRSPFSSVFIVAPWF